MSEFYFSKFPIITYANTKCRDISRRVVLSQDSRATPTVFYPYTIKAGLRADVLADAFYDDSYYDWLIYHTNGIIDPYYGWYLSEYDFNEFLKKKYGSIEYTQKKVKYYQLDFTTDDIDIPVSFYETNLPYQLRKYYEPNYGYSSKVISYKRRQEYWTVNTNQILKLDVANTSGSFIEGELVDLIYEQASVGAAEIVSSNDSVVIIQSISGNTSANNTIKGETSNVSAYVANSVAIQVNIPDDEYVYWSPIYVYEWERSKNEEKKHIQLLDANYALDVAEDLRVKLKE